MMKLNTVKSRLVNGLTNATILCWIVMEYCWICWTDAHGYVVVTKLFDLSLKYTYQQIIMCHVQNNRNCLAFGITWVNSYFCLVIRLIQSLFFVYFCRFQFGSYFIFFFFFLSFDFFFFFGNSFRLVLFKFYNKNRQIVLRNLMKDLYK